ncbi:MAG: hypothetical protein E7068_05150 [Lentimicrobiaceae bacterium]|nr:hypothetical protein [Lentimicrobiaceae bacterium]
MKFSFFHTPKPRTFNYIPRYYNPEQEALEKKKAAMGLDSKLSEREKRRMRIRNAYGYDPDDYKEKSKIGFKTVRYVLFFGLMFFFVYVIFETPFVERFFEMFLSLGK